MNENVSTTLEQKRNHVGERLSGGETESEDKGSRTEISTDRTKRR
jgi:hypothetical protein